MGLIILILFITVPIAEIATFIQVGEILGLWPTLGIVILTAILGTALLRHQGISTLMKAQKTLNEGGFPANELFDGVCLVFAGALLLTPGFITDGLGFLLFLPPFRVAIRGTVLAALKKNSRVHMSGGFHGPQGGPNPDPQHPNAPQRPHDPTIIDGEFEDLTPKDDSPWRGKD